MGITYFYPALSNRDYGWFRVGGPGLANCMFFAVQSLLSLPNVERCFFGNAFADMWAISKCKFVIASDSTFSAWGAFLGQLPILFSKRHFPPVYDGRIPEAVLGTSHQIPIEFKRYL